MLKNMTDKGHQTFEVPSGLRGQHPYQHVGVDRGPDLLDDGYRGPYRCGQRPRDRNGQGPADSGARLHAQRNQRGNNSHTRYLYRDIHIRDITCESAGVAVVIRGLPEQPIERVVLEDLHLNADEGIRCQDVDDLTLIDVTGLIQKEPLFSCSKVNRLNVTDMTLKSPNWRSDA